MRTALYLSCTAVALSPSAPAWSQTNDRADPTTTPAEAAAEAEGEQDATGDVVEERMIIVTGSKFQGLLDKPQVATVIDAEARNLAGVNGTRDLIATQPGFNFTENFGINVRGIGRQTAQTLLGQENAVIQYVDGFINLVPSNIAESTLFGGNVQFIRGPAGTTYGRNAIAGAINLQSRAPTKEFVGQAALGYGANDFYNIGVNISGPITDNLGFRLGAQRFHQNTYQENLGSAEGAGFAVKNLYLELQLEWTLGAFHIRNRTTTFRYSNQPSYPTVAQYNTTAVFGGLSPNPQYKYTVTPPSEPHQINVDFVGYDRLRDNLQTITNADLDLGGATLYYVGGYQQYVATGSADRDLTSRASYNALPTDPFAPGTVVPTFYTTNYDNDNHFMSHELRLESEQGSVIDWVAGAYYFKQEFDEQYWEAIPTGGDVLITGGGGGVMPQPNPRKAEYEQRNIYDIESKAIFGNVAMDITPTIRFDGGLRHTWDDKEALTDFRYVYYYPPFFAGDVSPAVSAANPSRQDEGLSGRAALAWRPNDNDQIYVSYARGYQSSAFTLGQGLPPNNIADSQHLDVYEIGGKLTRGKVRFDGSVFFQNFHDMQIPISAVNFVTNPTTGVTAPGPVFTRFTNAERAEIYGLEAQLTFEPTPRSNIVASYTYLHPTFASFCPPIANSTECGVVDVTKPRFLNPPTNTQLNPDYIVDLTGNEVPRTPRHKASLYGYHAIDIGQAGTIYPGGTIVYQSRYFTNAFEQGRVAGRALVNATLTYRTANERLDITGVVTNLFNKAYSDSAIATNLGGAGVQLLNTYAAPRLWNITARYRF
ncbi:TonB-dependent receptor [Parafrankia sp. BMG5.11]|uniref:TonB-dependent receptor n=1 Tax=Parafrankia sp. BMG5.11 TaxID=222540 RepID=UPI00140459D2|nr:TonB-dependent receptor [Parafrankia sp. BMG5.11]